MYLVGKELIKSCFIVNTQSLQRFQVLFHSK